MKSKDRNVSTCGDDDRMREHNLKNTMQIFLIAIISLGWMLAFVASGIAAVPIEECSLKTAADSIDLRQFKTPDKAQIHGKYVTLVSYEVDGNVPQAFNDCVAELKRMGCAEPPETTSKSVSDDYATIVLTKDGYSIFVNAMPRDKTKSGVTVRNQARLDCSTLPSLDDGHNSYIGPTFAMFTTAVKVPDAINQVSDRLKKDGWQEYAPAHTARMKNDQFEMRTFRRGAIDLTVNASVAPAQDNKTSIQYGVSMLLHELPAPLDATNIELGAEQVLLMCQAPGDVNTVANFYRSELPKIGYEETKGGGKTANAESMIFRNAEKDVLFVNLKTSADKGTEVKLEGLSAHAIAEMEKRRKEK